MQCIYSWKSVPYGSAVLNARLCDNSAPRACQSSGPIFAWCNLQYTYLVSFPRPFHRPFNSASMLVLLKCFPGSTSRYWKICTGKQHVSLFSTLSSCFLLSLSYVAFLFFLYFLYLSLSPHTLSPFSFLFLRQKLFFFVATGARIMLDKYKPIQRPQKKCVWGPFSLAHGWFLFLEYKMKDRAWNISDLYPNTNSA